MREQREDDPSRLSDWRREVRRRLHITVAAERESEIVEELAQDLEQRYESLRLQGMPEAEARRQVLELMDDGVGLSRNLARVETSRPERHDVTGGSFVFAGLIQDARLALRLFTRDPLFALVSVLTLAFGIGANLAMFNVANGVLWQPLPFRDPEQLVHVRETRPQGSVATYTSLPNYSDWRASNRSFADMAAYTDTSATLTGAGDAVRLDAIQISANLLPLIGVEPAVGRNFTSDEDRQHGAAAALLSHHLWEQRFGADPGIVGKSMTLNGEAHTIVGVMPRQFRFPIRAAPVDIYLPIERDRFPQMRMRDGRLIHVVARRRPDATVEEASAEMATIAGRLAQAYPATNAGWSATVTPVREDWFASSRQPLLLLLGAVGFVLLIACANLASLALARATRQQRDLAVRRALGASRARLVQQLMVQSATIACAGGAIGIAMSVWLRAAVLGLAPASLPRLGERAIDVPTLAGAFVVTLLTGILVGAAPAWLTSRAQPLGTDRGSAGVARHNRFLSLLLVGEIAGGLILLAGAGLFTQSLTRLMSVSPGFEPADVLAVPIELSPTAYPNAAARAAFYSAVLDRLQTIPGVNAAAVAFPLPFDGAVAFPFTIDGSASPARRLGAYYRSVSPDYFATLRVPLRSGRVFTEDDRAASPPVMIVNEALARQFFPRGDALGQRLTITDRNEGDSQTSREIVGIVGNVRHLGLDRPSGPEMYVPYQQAPSQWMAFAIRAGDASRLTDQMKSAVHAIDPGVPVQDTHLLAEGIARSTEHRKFSAQLLGAFAFSAVLLAMLGIAGTTAYVVVQRTPELAVRVAMGATFTDVLRMILGGTLRVALAGVVTGLLAAAVLSRAVQGLLYDISASDPATLIVVASLMILLALVAALGPALRAAHIDPIVALRRD